MSSVVRCPECRSEDIVYRRKRSTYICQECDYEFVLETEGRKRIFISYGHDEYAMLAEALKSDLTERGHQVWFDRERINIDHDWETQIEKGLDWVSEDPARGRFILLMTPHSVRRPDGFCLNEIARAVSRRLTFIPVMVVWCEPPLSICRLQWLDMQDCVPVLENKERYKKKLELLIQAIEKDQLDYEGSQARLLNWLEPLRFEAEISDHLKKFIGREWVVETIDSWIASPGSQRIFWITGKPGVGKSAISSWLCTYRREIAAFHFCRHGHVYKSDPRKCVLSLAYQLSTQLPDYQNYLLKDINLQNVINESDAKTMFDLLIVQPLSGSFKKPDRLIVILIDALDEATVGNNNELAAFIASEFEKTPEWLRLIITSRPDPEVEYWLRAVPQFSIDQMSQENKKDLQSYLRQELGAKADQKIIDTIVDKSEGIFLYVQMICREVAAGRYSLERLYDFPQGLQSFFAEFFGRQFSDSDQYHELVRPGLELIASAREPLPVQMIASLLKWNEYHLIDFSQTIGSLFLIVDGIIQPFHNSLMNWITDIRGASKKYYISSAEGEKRLAGHGWNEYQSGSGMSGYFLKHLPSHLTKTERWSDLQTILSDFTFIETKCRSGMVHDLIRDYSAALVQDKMPVDIKKTVDDYFRFVSTNRIPLATTPEVTLQQAANEPDSTLPAQKAQHRLKSGNLPWIRWVNKPQERSSCLMNFSMHKLPVVDCAFFPDGSTVLSASQDGIIRLWDIASGDEVASFGNYTSSFRHGVFCCSLSRDGSIIASGWADGNVAIWDLKRNKTATILNHSGEVIACALSPDGRRLATVSFDMFLKLWDTETGDIIYTMNLPGGKVTGAGGSNTEVQWSGFSMGKEKIPTRRELVNACDKDVLAEFYADNEAVMPLSCSFSPQGTLATGFTDGSITLWNARTGERLRTFTGHTGYVMACAFSPCGGKMLSGSSDNTIKLWDIESGREINTFHGHNDIVTSCSFSPDGKWVLSGSDDRTVKLWEASTGLPMANFSGHTGKVLTCAFSRDGSRILSGSYDKTLKLWDLAVEAGNTPVTGHARAVNDCIYSPDGTRIASCSEDKTVKLWDGMTGTELFTLKGHKSPVNTCAFSPYGTFLVSCSKDHRLIMWDTDTGEKLASFIGHRGDVISCRISPDGSKILSISRDETIRLWDACSGTEIKRHTGSVGTGMLFDMVWEASEKTFFKSQITEKGAFREKRLSFKGRAEPAGPHEYLENKNIKAAAADGLKTATVSDDNVIRIKNLKTGKELAIPARHDYHVKECRFSADGMQLVVAFRDLTLKSWDTETGTLIFIIEAINGMSRSQLVEILEHGTFSPDGKTVISGLCDGTIRFWNSDGGYSTAIYPGHPGIITAYAVSPDNVKLIMGFSDGVLKLWDISKNKELLSWRGHSGRIERCGFSPDGKRILTGADGTKIWDTSTGAEITRLEGRMPEGKSGLFSPDGAKTATIKNDNLLMLWDIAGKSKLIGTFLIEAGFKCVSWHPNGRLMAVGTNSGKVYLFTLENVAVKPLILTMYGSKNPRAGVLCCPVCKCLSEVNQSLAGTEVICPNCRQPVVLNVFSGCIDWRTGLETEGKTKQVALTGHKADIQRSLGDLDGALSLYQKQWSVSNDTGNPYLAKASLINQAKILNEKGDFKGGMLLYKKLEQISRKYDYVDGIIASLTGKLELIGPEEGAGTKIALLRDIEAACRRSGNGEALASCLSSQAGVFEQQNDIDRVLNTLQEAKEIYLSLEDYERALECAAGQFNVSAGVKGNNHIMKLLKEIEKISRTCDNEGGLASSLEYQGDILMEQGDLKGAIMLYREMEEILRKHNHLRGVGNSLNKQAHVLYKMRELDKALSLLKKAEEIYRRIDDKEALQRCLHNQEIIAGKED